MSKSGFLPSQYGGMAMQTDSLNPYPANNTSVFYVWKDSNYSSNFFLTNYANIEFWHYYDVDSLSDSCLVQITTDSGATWKNYNEIQAPLSWNYTIESNLAPYNYSKFLWTGKSNGWQKVQICFSFFPVKPERGWYDGFGYRFLFKSDSISNNRPGWIIDKISLRRPTIIEGLRDFQYQSLEVYPNPSLSGIFHVSYPSNYVKGTIQVYDKLGRLVLNTKLSEQIDLSALPADLYYYKAHFESSDQWYSGVLNRE